MQIEALDSQIGVYRPGIRAQELRFCNFCELTPDSFKFWDEDLFFWSSSQISWKIARILRRQAEFVEILGRRPFFLFLVFTFFV